MPESKGTTDTRSYLRGRTGPLRPILTLLNGDQSWLMSFPLPSADAAGGGKKYFHVVTDPWLHGSLSLFHPWLLGIDNPVPAAAPDGAAVEGLIREIEEATATASRPDAHERRSLDTTAVDAIFILFDQLDHLHGPSLVTFPPSTPVFATREATPKVHALAHFDSVITTGDLPGSGGSGDGWRACHPGAPLPAWLSVFRLPGHAMLNFASAIVWTHDGAHEVVLNAPHGIRAGEAAVRALFARDAEDGGGDRVEALAMLAALKDSFAFGMAQTTGLKGVLELEGVVRPRYWVRSHDAELQYKGLIMMSTYDVHRTLEDVMMQATEAGAGDSGRKPNLVEVENGASFVLV